MTEYLIEKNNANIVLVASVANDELQLHYGEDDLTAYAALTVGRDPGQTITFRIDDFSHGGESWLVAATPQLTVPRTSWVRNRTAVTDAVAQYVDTSVEVTVTATASGTGATKVKRIHIQTPPKNGLPDPRRK